MYLVSLYFDEKTNQRLKQYIKQVAERTGNTFMIEGNVPPHITVGAFESKASHTVLIEALEQSLHDIDIDFVQLVSIGAFQTSTIFLNAVYNEYLHKICKGVCETLKNVENTIIRRNHQPFQWIPHVSIGKTLTKEQQLVAFETLQNSFGPLEASVVKIGLSKTNPYLDIKTIKLL